MKQFKLETVLATFPQLKAFGLVNMGFYEGELVSTSDYDWQDSGVTEQDIVKAYEDGKIEIVKEEVKTTKLNNETIVIFKDNGMKYVTRKKFDKLPEYEKQQLITLFNSILGNMVLPGDGEQEIVEHLIDMFGLPITIDMLD